ncbi:membrane-associating domain-containing protein [Xylogone sp. PMI_703]|nr:membrane-associating domain-containing protein [Xylogone sp. PMI_703]
MGFGILPLRIAQFVFAIIILGLTGYVSSWYNEQTSTPSPARFNFLFFAAIFSLLSILYLELSPRVGGGRASHPYANLAFEFLNTIFLFSGFVALAVFLASVSFCVGPVCGCARADAVFLSFVLVLWLATNAIHVYDFLKGGLSAAQTDRKATAVMKETAAQVRAQQEA